MVEKTDENALGIGSYGAVYRARVGHLPCAAKILHPTLFQASDPGSDRIRTLFEQECRVLRRIRHPHVIQFIKSYQDKETGLPVLIMELMDENLTHYLTGLGSTPVPYHIKLNVAHDVALALEFLHGVGVLHRDLSSNNVLLIAGKRAKVTDFGMAKVWEGHTQTTPATTCPGTVAYMPPEAFKAEPLYTEKLDIFSAGVVYLQILTKKFPNPRDRVRQEYNDERYPTGIEVIIPERVRRQEEIAMATPDDPLLLIALDCIHDKAFMRPSAGEVCVRIEALKSTSWSEFVSEQERLDREGVLGRLAGGEGEENGIASPVREIETRVDVDALQEQLSRAELTAGDLRAQLQDKESEIEELKKKLVKSERAEREREEEVRNMRESVREKQEMLMLQGDRYQLDRGEEIAERDLRIAELEKQLQQDLSKRDQLSLPLPLVHRTHSASDISMSSRSPPSPHPPEMKWRLYGTARAIEGNSSAMSDSVIFFTDGMVVLQFTCLTGDWTTLPPCPKHSFAIAVVGGLPTAVGGYTEREGNSPSLLSLTTEGHHRLWKITYPAMRFGRTCPSTVTMGNLLVVAGGHGTEESGRCVEVLDTSTMVWTQAASLTFSLWRASVATCGDRLYLAGGEKEGKPLGCHDVLYCSLADLRNSTHSLPVHKKLRPFKFSSSTHKVWHTAAKLPAVHSTLVSYHGQLFAVGGQNRGTNIPVSDVHRYSASSNEWTVSGHMTIPRSRCFAVCLHGNQLMVLGGSVESYTLTDSIEIAQLTS